MTRLRYTARSWAPGPQSSTCLKPNFSSSRIHTTETAGDLVFRDEWKSDFEDYAPYLKISKLNLGGTFKIGTLAANLLIAEKTKEARNTRQGYNSLEKIKNRKLQKKWWRIKEAPVWNKADTSNKILVFQLVNIMGQIIFPSVEGIKYNINNVEII